MSVVVKICGIRTAPDAEAAVAAGVDLLGLNFVPSSPRCVTLAGARAIAAAVPRATLVGVFADADRDTIARMVDAVGLAGLQFHGEESPAFCRGWAPWTIKALRTRPGDDLAARAARYDTDYLLVDSFVRGVGGGTGVPLDPDVARGLPCARLIVAGGLDPERVADVVRRVRPYGVDVASGVERSPGVKDHDKIAAFVRRAKAA